MIAYAVTKRPMATKISVAARSFHDEARAASLGDLCRRRSLRLLIYPPRTRELHQSQSLIARLAHKACRRFSPRMVTNGRLRECDVGHRALEFVAFDAEISLATPRPQFPTCTRPRAE
jgi:hypothetical protein